MEPSLVTGGTLMADGVLAHATDAELATAVSANLHALFQAMRVLPGYESVDHPLFSGHVTSLANPMFRGVWGARLTSAHVDGAIDEAIAWFALRRAPDFLWWTGPHTEPIDLPARLLERGFDGNRTGDPGMALELEALSLVPSLPEGLTVVRATAERQLQEWRDVFTQAFEAPLAAGQAWIDATVQAGREAAPWQLYVGYQEGRPVATSLVFPGAGVLGVYAVGTIPEVRRQGIGGGITAASLRAAQAGAYRYAVLFTTRLGHAVYRRLGFREVAGTIGIYSFEPPGRA